MDETPNPEPENPTIARRAPASRPKRNAGAKSFVGIAAAAGLVAGTGAFALTKPAHHSSQTKAVQPAAGTSATTAPATGGGAVAAAPSRPAAPAPRTDDGYRRGGEDDGYEYGDDGGYRGGDDLGIPFGAPPQSSTHGS